MATRRKRTAWAGSPGATAAAPPADALGMVGAELAQRLRGACSFTEGDQVAPGVVLWTDPERLWEGALADLKQTLPELFVLGAYNSEERSGPAIWLRCIEARLLEPFSSTAKTPILYLPGVSKQQLREVEECPVELQPLVELQFRGTVWAHPNGKDWTPYAFLTSEYGGLGLEVAKDAATGEALLRALRPLLRENVSSLVGRRLDADFFDRLLAPDPLRVVLAWMSDPTQSKSGMGINEWKAFCRHCAKECGFHPEKDGELRAAELLGQRQGKWATIWDRFAEAPGRYPGVVRLLERAAPQDGLLANQRQDSWPQVNAERESELGRELVRLTDKRADEAAARVLELEQANGRRRGWIWAEMGRSQLAISLEHLARLAPLVGKPIAAASVQEMGELYVAKGWEADREAIAALACCGGIEHEEPICAAVTSLYVQWLEESTRNLQSLVKARPDSLKPRLGPVEARDGQVIVFADGLRYDVAHMLLECSWSGGTEPELQWDWSPIPSVTGTAKPLASPVAHLLKGTEPGDDFGVTIAETGQHLTQDRFESILKASGVQILEGLATGDPAGRAWTEADGPDKRGHDEGWKLARRIDQDVQDLAKRIHGLLAAGWKQVLVVTDHGWLLLPNGLPKISLPKFLVEERWGRCASMRESSRTTLPLLPWYWNPTVSVASPPGIGCFKAGMEYSHGGVSLQEMVVPRIIVRQAAAAASASRLADVKWIGLRCRVTVQQPVPGLKVDVRTRQADAGTSTVEGKEGRELSEDGTVSLPMGDDCEEGSAVVVVLLAQNRQVLHSLPTVVGGER